jgi:hypothetical protein
VLHEFTKVMPTDLKRVLRERMEHEEEQEAEVHDWRTVKGNGDEASNGDGSATEQEEGEKAEGKGK